MITSPNNPRPRRLTGRTRADHGASACFAPHAPNWRPGMNDFQVVTRSGGRLHGFIPNRKGFLMTKAKTYYNGPPVIAANGLALRILPGSTLSDVCAAGHMTPPNNQPLPYPADKQSYLVLTATRTVTQPTSTNHKLWSIRIKFISACCSAKMHIHHKAALGCPPTSNCHILGAKRIPIPWEGFPLSV